MASKRHVRQRHCTNKKAYYSYQAAQSAQERVEIAEGRNIDVYSCSYCGNYHIGHADKSLSRPHGAKYDPVAARRVA